MNTGIDQLPQSREGRLVAETNRVQGVPARLTRIDYASPQRGGNTDHRI